MSKTRELAYRYDLLVAPDWRERFDCIVSEEVQLPTKGCILDVNCGTGGYAIEMAEKMGGQGEVTGTDSCAERIEIARAKANVKKIAEVTFEQSLPYDLGFQDDEFDAVIGDASLLPEDVIEDMLVEMLRVAAPDATLVLKLATRGSFDEFFSLYWEVLHDAGLDGELWSDLQSLINERPTVSDAEATASRAGLRNVVSVTRKEEFLYETGDEFLASPLIADNFLSPWLEIVSEDRRQEIYDALSSIIERERVGAPFDVSIKATVIKGLK